MHALQGYGFEVAGYDPALDEWRHDPAAADLVVVVSVLDIVEPTRLKAVIDRIFALARCAVWAWVVVESPLGRTVPPSTFWISEFARRGRVVAADVEDGVLAILAQPRTAARGRAIV